MDWGSFAVGLVVGALIGPAAWALVRTLFGTESDTEAGIVRD